MDTNEIKEAELRIQKLISDRENATFYTPILVKDLYSTTVVDTTNTTDTTVIQKNKAVSKALKNLVKSKKYIITEGYIERVYTTDIMNDGLIDQITRI